MCDSVFSLSLYLLDEYHKLLDLIEVIPVYQFLDVGVSLSDFTFEFLQVYIRQEKPMVSNLVDTSHFTRVREL